MSSAGKTETSSQEAADDPELRILLIGGITADKTLVMEKIQSFSESSDPSDPSEPSEPSAKRAKTHAVNVKLEGRDLLLFDTPGLCGAAMSDEDVIREIKTCISTSARHVFLFVLKMDRFTTGKRKMVELVKSSFGEDVTKSMVLVFQGEVPNDERTPIEEDIAQVKSLREFDEQCSQRHVVFYAGEEEDPSEVRKLKKHIDHIVKESGGKCYTHEMMMLAESADDE